MVDHLNILFTSVGRRVSLVNSFRAALVRSGIQGQLVGVDVTRRAPAMHVVDVAITTPPYADSDYIPRLLEICKQHTIGLVIPLADPDLLALAPARSAFESIGAFPLMPGADAIQICADKRKTHRFLIENDFETGMLYESSDGVVDQDVKFPIIVKPAFGSAGIGVQIVNDRTELDFYLGRTAEPIIQELLDGDELTVDVFVDRNGEGICAVPRRRLEVRAGEVSKAVTVRDPHVIGIAKSVASALPGAVGPITVQGFLVPDGRFKVIEINPRFGGGIPLSVHAGAEFPEWSMGTALGIPLLADESAWESGAVMLRYDEAIYTTLDGTG